MCVDHNLPPLVDADHNIININHYNNPFDTHPLSLQALESQNIQDHIPQFDESTDSKSNSNAKSKSVNTVLSSTTSLELLSRYRSKFISSKEVSIDEVGTDSVGTLSTVEIINLAAEKFISFSANKANGYTMFTHPYGSSAFTRLSMDEIREVELVFQLLTAAEKVGKKQFEIASKFLVRCGWVASDDGSPVERLVFHLCDALQERIGKETGMPAPKKPKKFDQKNENPLALGANPSFLASHQTLPFTQVWQLCGIQAIIDQVGTSSKVHLIDIHIRSGIQWTALIQALSERKSEIELLKITAFATSSDIQKVGETGKRLECFAKTLSLPFVFKILVLSDITEVKEEQFDVQDGEAVAVYCQVILRTMISRPQSLENLMRAIRKINPLVIVVAEVEANHNSTSFVNRFTEALFFYGAFFDCLEACMCRDDVHRGILEGVHFADGMKNIVACEGDERVSRSVNINTWRLFFKRFGMVEIELSDSCMYQANLVLQQFSCASSCTLQNNGKCLIIGWKGTPLQSLSTWKFVQE
ncbi:DELLA protein RGL1 [Helianthus annuus]|uniref:DELLA protein RGL1 n=1 Tax=Helianthus annuus TaxID=4232 RepID=UPI001652D591|nr:DELLA protein RGL1 [Helianthus annuus]